MKIIILAVTLPFLNLIGPDDIQRAPIGFEPRTTEDGVNYLIKEEEFEIEEKN